MATPAGGRPLKPVAPSHAEEKQQANQQKPRVPELEKHLAGNLASKKELLTGMRFGIALKMKDSLLSRSSLLMCQMSWHLQNRNNHQLRKQKLPQLRVQQPLLHLKLMLSQKGLKVRMPRIWIRRVIRITTFPALGSSASTLSGLGHDKVVAFPKRAALLLSTILFLAHHSQPSIQGIHRQGTRIAQNLHLTPSLETLGRFDSMRSSRDFDQGNGFPTFDDIPDPFGSSAPFRSSLDSQTQRRDSDPFGSSGPFRTSLDSQTPRKESDFFGFSAAPFRTSLTVKLQEETRTHFGPLHLGHHSLQEETRTHLGLQGLSGRHWRLQKRL
ncbi:hypothetical protein ACFX1X_035610 [Malus domestica]